MLPDMRFHGVPLGASRALGAREVELF
jgi:hypothetical protein